MKDQDANDAAVARHVAFVLGELVDELRGTRHDSLQYMIELARMTAETIAPVHAANDDHGKVESLPNRQMRTSNQPIAFRQPPNFMA